MVNPSMASRSCSMLLPTRHRRTSPFGAHRKSGWPGHLDLGMHVFSPRGPLLTRPLPSRYLGDGETNTHQASPGPACLYLSLGRRDLDWNLAFGPVAGGPRLQGIHPPSVTGPRVQTRRDKSILVCIIPLLIGLLVSKGFASS